MLQKTIPVKRTSITKNLSNCYNCCSFFYYFECTLTTSKLDSFFISFFFRRTMVKTNTQKQREYREPKKLNDPKFLEKERKQQKAYYVKTSNLSKNKLKERRIDIKERVCRSRARRKFSWKSYAMKIATHHQPIPCQTMLILMERSCQ